MRQRLRYSTFLFRLCGAATSCKTLEAAPGLIFGEAVHGTPLDRFRSPTGALTDGRASALGEEVVKKIASASAVLHAVISTACVRIVAHSPAANNAAAPLRAQQGPRTQVTQQPSQRKCAARRRRGQG